MLLNYVSTVKHECHKKGEDGILIYKFSVAIFFIYRAPNPKDPQSVIEARDKISKILMQWMEEDRITKSNMASVVAV